MVYQRHLVLVLLEPHALPIAPASGATLGKELPVHKESDGVVLSQFLVGFWLVFSLFQVVLPGF